MKVDVVGIYLVSLQRFTYLITGQTWIADIARGEEGWNGPGSISSIDIGQGKRSRIILSKEERGGGEWGVRADGL